MPGIKLSHDAVTIPNRDGFLLYRKLDALGQKAFRPMQAGLV